MAVTAVAVLGGAGALPSAASGPAGSSASSGGAYAPAALSAPAGGEGVPGPSPSRDRGPGWVPPVPVGAGEGRRVVFSEGQQRVWLVGGAGRVQRSYLVSGSIYDNLDPGTYRVYSRSEQAWGIDDSGTMRWFVRFTQGENAAIGFHDIPVDDGRKVQTVDELGTPTSHGCIRQRPRDARALWEFAPLGTTVVVVA
ncbi:L,D-transpeptidase [Nocardioides sp. GCM10027113]|uniref:L,D-transpeptidase n=1 Tax=unclassified Nocardioides TaxID=2615069 RepID=UPI0036208492